MTIVVVIIHVIVCLILILVILLQAGRGQGLTGPSFASGNVQSLFGTGAADFLTKATSVAAIAFIITSITLDYIESKKSKSLLNFDQKSSQIDVDSIKKALERVKDESATASEAGTAGVDNIAAAIDEKTADLETAVTEQASNLTDQANALQTDITQSLPSTDQSDVTDTSNEPSAASLAETAEDLNKTIDQAVPTS